MSQVTVTKCDVCGAIKGEANKWVGVVRHPIKDVSNYPALYIRPVALGNYPDNELDVCSDTCLQKLVSEVVSEIRAQEKP